MTDTYNFQMPLIDAAQAQKHVTINEALARADAAVQLRLVARNVTVPPAAVDGAAYGVGVGGVDDWSGHDGSVAVYANGGWVFMVPKAGWRGWDESAGVPIVHDGTDWRSDAVSISAGGAVTRWRIAEIDHVIGAGATSTTINIIPANAQVVGVTGRVISAITGTGIGSWSLGVAGAVNRYGSGLGLGLNSYAKGRSGQPQTYYAATPLLLSADAGSFGAGTVRLCVHYVEISEPYAV